jgi:putative acetyltransferase
MPTGTLGLGPVAVLARYRRQGIAASLIGKGLRRAREDGWRGVFVVGNPDYYSRFGFDAVLAARFASPYAGPYLLALALQNDGLPSHEAKLDYPAAFAGLE